MKCISKLDAIYTPFILLNITMRMSSYATQTEDKYEVKENKKPIYDRIENSLRFKLIQRVSLY